MIPLTANAIVEVTGASILSGAPSTTATSVSIDSRRTAAGACFFAIRGDRKDGHEFVPAAAAAGATMLVVSAPPVTVPAAGCGHPAVLQVADTTAALQQLAGWLRRHLDPTVVAITGSLGKTTTKELATALLRTRYRVHATPGNLNNHWGLPLSLLGLGPGHEVMVAELAMSHAGEIRALARLAAPDIAIITNVAPVHMENFTDLDAVAAAKAELAEQIGAGATLIAGADDPRTAAMAARFAPRVGRVLTFGRGEGADVRATGVTTGGEGSRFDLRLPGGERVAVRLQLPGAAGIANFLAAATVAWALEVPVDVIAATAGELQPLANRGALRKLGGVRLVDESYNASPQAVAGALDNLATLPASGRRIAVLGDMLEMGAWTEAVHREAGAQAAAAGVDLLLAVGAQAGHVAAGAAQAGMRDEQIHCFEDAGAAGAWLAPLLADGDAVLVKGSRGVRMERVVEAVVAAAEVTDGVRER